jgi:ABC-2 type transport system ATP-binding protein
LESLAIECTQLVKTYGDKHAVAGIDLTVRAGSCFGLLGPNGAGKTTTVEMLEGLHPPTSGSIRLLGMSWNTGQDHALRQRIGVQLQETQLGDKLHVDEVLTLFRSFYPEGKSTEELLHLLDLEDHRHQQYCRLSGGQKQRVAVACALVGNPELLFLDEPTTGLDPRARQSLWRVVEQFRTDGGTVLLTTHYMEEAAALCDELAVMDHGKIIASGTPRSLVDGLGDVQFLEFETTDPLDEGAFRALPAIQQIERRGQHYRLRLDRSLAALASVLRVIDEQRATPIGLSTHQATLDDVFIHLTGRGLANSEAPP